MPDGACPPTPDAVDHLQSAVIQPSRRINDTNAAAAFLPHGHIAAHAPATMPLRQATRACSTSSLVAGAPPWARRPQAALWSMQSGQPTESHTVNRVMWFFAIVYAVEGIGQAKSGVICKSGVIWQPLVHFLKQ